MIEYYYYDEETNEPLTKCPKCGTNFLQEGSVSVYLSVAGRELEVDSCLLPDGKLKDTNDNAVANGFHTGTVCTGCGSYLFEVAEEDYVEKSHE